MQNKTAKPSMLIIAAILSLGLTGASQFLRPSLSTPYAGQPCSSVVGDPPCPTTLTTTVKRGFPIAYKTLIYQTDTRAARLETAVKTIQSDTFSLTAFGWSAMIWFGALLLAGWWWQRGMSTNIAKDRIVLGLAAILAGLLITYQVAGADNAKSVLVRDFINVFQFVLLVLFGYLMIRPVLQRSIAKSTTTRAKVGKTILGVFCAMVIAVAVAYILFALAFSLAFSHG